MPPRSDPSRRVTAPQRTAGHPAHAIRPAGGAAARRGVLGGLVIALACRLSDAPASAGPAAPVAVGPAPQPAPPPPESLPPLAPLWYARVFAEPTGNGFTVATDSAQAYLLAGTLRAYDLATGRVRWDLPGAIDGHAIGPVSDGSLVVAAAHTVTAVDARTGRRRWTVRPPAFAGYAVPALDARSVYVGTSGREPAAVRVLALDRATGATRWSATLGEVADGEGDVRGLLRVGTTLYVTAAACPLLGCHAQRTAVLALDPATGRERWRVPLTPTPGSPYADEAVLLTDGVVATGRWLLGLDHVGNRVLAIDTVRREVAWTATFDGRYGGASSPPAVDSAAGVVYAASGEGRIYALDLETGATRWRSPSVGGSLFSAYRCGRGVVGSALGLYAFGVPGGAVLAKAFTDPDGEYALATFAVEGRRVVFGTTLGLAAAACP